MWVWNNKLIFDVTTMNSLIYYMKWLFYPTANIIFAITLQHTKAGRKWVKKLKVKFILTF